MSTGPQRLSILVTDDWLEAQCRSIASAGKELANTVGQINQRIEGVTGDQIREVIAESHLRETSAVGRALHEVQLAVQNALFDCEHELRSLRERDISPVELLVDGERLIQRYRFLRRRARVIDGLLAYLPAVTAHIQTCVDNLRRLREVGNYEGGNFLVPDCGFALVALDQLRDEDTAFR
jgi:hypothetical protein